jgi:hypothetical protein
MKNRRFRGLRCGCADRKRSQTRPAKGGRNGQKQALFYGRFIYVGDHL